MALVMYHSLSSQTAANHQLFVTTGCHRGCAT